MSAFAAHQLLVRVETQRRRHPLMMALFYACCTELLDVSNTEVLPGALKKAAPNPMAACVAPGSSEHTQPVRKRQQFWSRGDISGVPSKVSGRKNLLTGSQSSETYAQVLQRCLAESAQPLPPAQQTGYWNAMEWKTSDGLTDYDEAAIFMETRVAAITEGEADECIWLLEHPPLYTAGTSARREDLTDPDRFPVYESKRGGQYTYHGPGQRVVYVMLNIDKRGRDVRRFVQQLEKWVIAALAEFNVIGEIREGRVGVWIQRHDKPLTVTGQMIEDKIAAIGIRLRKWVSFHGISINVEPDLTHYTGIVPCGIQEHGVTSLVDLGLPVTMDDVDVALKKTFDQVFASEGI